MPGTPHTSHVLIGERRLAAPRLRHGCFSETRFESVNSGFSTSTWWFTGEYPIAMENYSI